MADGKPIQVKDERVGEWIDYSIEGVPNFSLDYLEWRVKPEPFVIENYIWLDAANNDTRVSVSISPNVRFIFDPDTKKLVNVEVIG